MLVAGLVGGLIVGLTVMYAGWLLVRSLAGAPEQAHNKDEQEADPKG